MTEFKPIEHGDYAVLFREEEVNGRVLAYVPDFDIWTVGNTQEDAERMVWDAIGVTALDMAKDGKEILKPTPFYKFWIGSVWVDFREYEEWLKEKQKNDD